MLFGLLRFLAITIFTIEITYHSIDNEKLVAWVNDLLYIDEVMEKEYIT